MLSFTKEQEELLHKLLDIDIKVMTQAKEYWKHDEIMRKVRENEIEVALSIKRDLYQN